MTGLTADDRADLNGALAAAGCPLVSAGNLAAAQNYLTRLIRLAERLDGDVRHLAGQLAGDTRPAELSAVQRDHIRAVEDEIRATYERVTAVYDLPVPFRLTLAGEAVISQEGRRDGGQASNGAAAHSA